MNEPRETKEELLEFKDLAVRLLRFKKYNGRMER